MKTLRSLALAGLSAGLLAGAASAQSEPQSKATTRPDAGQQTLPGAQPGAVAYPDNPAATPAAGNEGAPVVTDRAACPSPGNGRCPDRPAPSGAASEPAPALPETAKP
jgi:hypothetical protein